MRRKLREDWDRIKDYPTPEESAAFENKLSIDWFDDIADILESAGYYVEEGFEGHESDDGFVFFPDDDHEGNTLRIEFGYDAQPRIRCGLYTENFKLNVLHSKFMLMLRKAVKHSNMTSY